jgi:hypothetical protein
MASQGQVQWLISKIPVTCKAEIGGSSLEASLGKKISKTLSQKQARHGGACDPRSQEAEAQVGLWSKA